MAKVTAREWTEKAKRNQQLVMRASTQDLMERITRRAAGTTDGGTVQVGKVPVVSSELINSHQVSLNGGVVATGANYSVAIAGFEVGGTLVGLFKAPHARPVHYGWTSSKGKQVPGWFFVQTHVGEWPDIVNAAAARFKD